MYHLKLGLKLYTRTTTSKIDSFVATGGTGHRITGTWFVNQIGMVMSLCGTFHSSEFVLNKVFSFKYVSHSCLKKMLVLGQQS